MKCAWYHLIFLASVVQFVPITEAKSIRCIPHSDYISTCNRCWCTSNAEFICARIKCNQVPNQFWGAMKPHGTLEGAKAIETFYKKTRSEKVEVHLLPMLTNFFKDILKGWSKTGLQEFFNFIRQIAHRLGSVWLQALGIAIE